MKGSPPAKYVSSASLALFTFAKSIHTTPGASYSTCTSQRYQHRGPTHLPYRSLLQLPSLASCLFRYMSPVCYMGCMLHGPWFSGYSLIEQSNSAYTREVPEAASPRQNGPKGYLLGCPTSHTPELAPLGLLHTRSEGRNRVQESQQRPANEYGNHHIQPMPESSRDDSALSRTRNVSFDWWTDDNSSRFAEHVPEHLMLAVRLFSPPLSQPVFLPSSPPSLSPITPRYHHA